MNLRLLLLAGWLVVGVGSVMGQLNDPGPYVTTSSTPIPLNLDSLKKEIHFPDSCLIHKIEGVVRVKLLISTNGQVIKHVVKSSPHPLMTDEVVAKVYALLFTPAYDGVGKPVKYWVTIPFDFKIPKEDPNK